MVLCFQKPSRALHDVILQYFFRHGVWVTGRGHEAIRHEDFRPGVNLALHDYRRIRLLPGGGNPIFRMKVFDSQETGREQNKTAYRVFDFHRYFPF